MKKLLLILCVFTLSMTYGQTKANSELEFKESTINNLKISVDDVAEFKTINWKDIKEIFSNNNKKDTISLGFALKKNTKNKNKYSFTITGKTENIDNLISLSKKAITTLNNIQ